MELNISSSCIHSRSVTFTDEMCAEQVGLSLWHTAEPESTGVVVSVPAVLFLFYFQLRTAAF